MNNIRSSAVIPAAIVALLLVGAGCTYSGNGSVPSDKEEAPAMRESGGRTLDLSGQGLTALPQYVLSMSDLVTLDLSDNRLQGSLPAEIRALTALEELDASGNRMTGVPAEIGQLRNLRVLDLSDNELTGLPYELRNLTGLRVLDLSGNPYSVQDLDYIREGLPETTIIVE